MTSRGWSVHARLRDLERKLIRGGGFKLIPGGSLNDPIMESYLETVWKGHGKEDREQPECEVVGVNYPGRSRCLTEIVTQKRSLPHTICYRA